MKQNLFDLTGRTVVLTGATGRLGSAMALGLSEAGASLIIVGRDEKALGALGKKIESGGGAADSYPVDLRNNEEIFDFCDKISNRYGIIHGIVNNAYSGTTGEIGQISSQQYLDAYNVSVVASAELTKHLTPALEAAKGATVVNIASMYGVVSPDYSIYGNSGMNSPPHYGAAKAALIQFTRYAACHLAQKGIRVNAISPGPFPPEEFRQSKPEFYGNLVNKVPLKRIGDPKELVGSVVFLCSPASSYITGVNLPVDGGWTAW